MRTAQRATHIMSGVVTDVDPNFTRSTISVGPSTLVEPSGTRASNDKTFQDTVKQLIGDKVQMGGVMSAALDLKSGYPHSTTGASLTPFCFVWPHWGILFGSRLRPCCRYPATDSRYSNPDPGRRGGCTRLFPRSHQGVAGRWDPPGSKNYYSAPLRGRRSRVYRSRTRPGPNGVCTRRCSINYAYPIRCLSFFDACKCVVHKI